ncbi:hypothetical protein RB614_27365 [Phytohabitans sp. ZYX-F-186]|uniref:DUF2510 domain-containing protein n=1 Tax=Phytohabitans maris TaxID=3071409 RepID=A0ABU0ZMI3_9ACTN|nr:hypothetical protein [Phytohabitans sp. ZYX-F-186]MDQ7908251.1 hypothetical protein [Phytohabitans sp. ZYX-F-186]
MTAPPPGQHYTPDGRFWWDGAGWRPVAAAPPGPGFPPPGGALPRRPAKAGFVLALAGTLVAAALCGGLAGGIGGAASTEPPDSDTPPALAAEFPSGERQYMTGVTLDVVVEDWMKKSNSWTCAEKDADPDGYVQVKKMTECGLPDDEDRDTFVTVGYDAADKIKMVEATCRVGLKTNACTTLASTLADAVLSPQGDELRGQAGKWAKENVDSERATTIGGIRLTASLDPHRMTATPAV